jgi:hypothetical protein
MNDARTVRRLLSTSYPTICRYGHAINHKQAANGGTGTNLLENNGNWLLG